MFYQEDSRDIYGDEATIENSVENPGKDNEFVTVSVVFYSGSGTSSMVYTADQAEEFANKILAAAKFAREQNA